MGNASAKGLAFTQGNAVGGLRFRGPFGVYEGAPNNASTSSSGSSTGSSGGGGGGGSGGGGAPGTPTAAMDRVLLFRHEKRSANGGGGSGGGGARDTDLAQNALRRLRMLRHPNVLKFIEGGETEEAILIATEWAQPLSQWMEIHRGDADFASSSVVGLYSLLTGLHFISTDCKCIHGALTTDAVWVTRGGDWKLAGFELLAENNSANTTGSADGPSSHLMNNDDTGLVPDIYKSPERQSKDWKLAAAEGAKWAIDSYSLGILIWEVFAGILRTSTDVKQAAACTGPSASTIPASVRPFVSKLLSSNPRSRPRFQDVLACDWFKQPLVGVLLFLDELALKEPKDKVKFFTALPKLLPSFPDSIAKYRILPSLMTALEFGAAEGGGTIVFAPILDIGAKLPPAEYASQIVPCVVRLFGSNDRATRLQLLQHLPTYVASLSDDILNGSVLQSIMTGFTDTNVILREATVKAALTLAPRLTVTNLQTVVIRALKKCLSDPEPAVRVNATICLGRVAEYVVGDNVMGAREEDILGSCLRAMRDPLPYARAAALRATAHATSLASSSYFTAETVSRRIMPAAAYLALDVSPDVRAAAFATIDASMNSLRIEDERLRLVEAQQAKQQAAAAAAGAGGAAGSTGGGGGSGGGGGGQQQGQGTQDNSSSGSSSSVSGGGYGSLMVGALGWAVSGIANRIIVTGAIDENSNSNNSNSNTANSGDNTPTASSSSSLSSSNAGGVGAVTTTTNSTRKKLRDPLLPSPSSFAAPSGEDADGWGGDDFDDISSSAGAGSSPSRIAPVVPRATSSSSTSATTTINNKSAAAAAREKETAGDGWGNSNNKNDTFAPTTARVASRTTAVTTTTTAAASASAGSFDTSSGSNATATATAKKGMSLKGSATRIVPNEKKGGGGGGGGGGDGWDEW